MSLAKPSRRLPFLTATSIKRNLDPLDCLSCGPFTALYSLTLPGARPVLDRHSPFGHARCSYYAQDPSADSTAPLHTRFPSQSFLGVHTDGLLFAFLASATLYHSYALGSSLPVLRVGRPRGVCACRAGLSRTFSLVCPRCHGGSADLLPTM